MPRLGVRFGRPLATKAAAPETAAARATGLSAYQQGQPYRAGWDMARAVRDGLERVVWVYRAVDAIASNQIRLPVRVRQDDADTGADIDDHPLVPLLNQYPNAWEDAGSFRYRLSAQLLLSPRGVFVELERSNAGKILNMWLLPPQYTAPVPDPRTFIKEYRVEIPGYPMVPLDPANVVWIRRPHPLDPYRSMTPLEAAGLSVDNDFYARLYNRRFLQSDARPSVLIAVEGNLGDKQARELRAKIEAGGPGSLALIDNAGTTTVKDLATSPHDMQFSELGMKSKEEILSAFGVPESLTNASKRTFDNAGVEKRNFWTETMETHCGFVARPFDRLDGDTSTFVAFDFASIAVLQTDRIERENHVIEMVKGLLMTPEEGREESGLEPSGDPDLDKFYAPINLVPIGARIPAPPAEDQPAPVSVGSREGLVRPKALARRPRTPSRRSVASSSSNAGNAASTTK